jgi:[protein-PII] uridylyltransferase
LQGFAGRAARPAGDLLDRQGGRLRLELGELQRQGIVPLEGMRDAMAREDWLSHLRIRMHFMVGRREDRLLFDYQSNLAARYGFVNTPAKRASEQLMQEYYRNAKAVTLLNTILLQNMGAALAPQDELAPQPIDDDFQAVGSLLDLHDEALFVRKPHAIFDAFLVMQSRHELLGMTARTLRALWRACEQITPEFRADPANRSRFLKLFLAEQGIIHEFRRMNQLDILGPTCQTSARFAARF